MLLYRFYKFPLSLSHCLFHFCKVTPEKWHPLSWAWFKGRLFLSVGVESKERWSLSWAPCPIGRRWSPILWPSAGPRKARNQGNRGIGRPPPAGPKQKIQRVKKFNNRLRPADKLITVSTVFEVSDQLICDHWSVISDQWSPDLKQKTLDPWMNSSISQKRHTSTADISKLLVDSRDDGSDYFGLALLVTSNYFSLGKGKGI